MVTLTERQRIAARLVPARASNRSTVLLPVGPRRTVRFKLSPSMRIGWPSASPNSSKTVAIPNSNGTAWAVA